MDIAVSVIVPVFNGADTIIRCINSIAEQTLENIEIIVVDDGSEDNTAELVRDFCDARIHIISQENSGQGFARNTGLDSAKGKYIAFADADDTMEKDMLKEMFERAEKTGADMVQCNICDVFSDGRRVTQLKPIDKTMDITNTVKYADIYFARCRHSYEVCNKMINREFLVKSGVRFCDTRKYFSEDLMFNMCLLKYLRRISFISESYYNYYQHSGSHFHSDTEQRCKKIYGLFYDYMTNEDNTENLMSYTAAMVILFNLGFCIETDTARQIIEDKFFRKCVKDALFRRCSVKHRIFLTAVYLLPLREKLKLIGKYSTRWT